MNHRFAYCLCPSYRKFTCLQTAMWLFQNQTYPYKRMYILEDSGLVEHARISDIIIISTEKRFRNLPLKYQYLIDILKPELEPDDAIIVWDDDDIYLEDFIERHMKVLEKFPVSAPSRSFIYYACALGYTGGFSGHGAMAFRAECLEKVPGWPITDIVEFDQLFVAELKKNFEFGDPCELGPPNFIYRWTLGVSGYHLSALGSGNVYRKLDEVLGPKNGIARKLKPVPDSAAIGLIEMAKVMIEEDRKAKERQYLSD